MIKYLILVLILSTFISCKVSKPEMSLSDYLSFKIELPEIIEAHERHVPIKVTLLNNSNKLLYVCNPQTWGGCFPRIKQNGKDAIILRPRVCVKCIKIIEIEPFGTYETCFEYDFDELVGEINKGEYEIYFLYCRKYDKKLSCIEYFKSNILRFSVK
jgi:hypothetical protein